MPKVFPNRPSYLLKLPKKCERREQNIGKLAGLTLSHSSESQWEHSQEVHIVYSPGSSLETMKEVTLSEIEGVQLQSLWQMLTHEYINGKYVVFHSRHTTKAPSDLKMGFSGH